MATVYEKQKAAAKAAEAVEGVHDEWRIGWTAVTVAVTIQKWFLLPCVLP
jgi:hypothetical protein